MQIRIGAREEAKAEGAEEGLLALVGAGAGVRISALLGEFLRRSRGNVGGELKDGKVEGGGMWWFGGEGMLERVGIESYLVISVGFASALSGDGSSGYGCWCWFGR
jgi:hypothetical protein